MLILFVDDDPDDYDLFSEAINAINGKAKCLHAIDGQQAIDLLTKTLVVLPNYIFLDVNMPLMGGKECLVKIRSIPPLKDVPIIVYSTTTNFSEIETFKD